MDLFLICGVGVSETVGLKPSGGGWKIYDVRVMLEPCKCLGHARIHHVAQACGLCIGEAVETGAVAYDMIDLVDITGIDFFLQMAGEYPCLSRGRGGLVDGQGARSGDPCNQCSRLVWMAHDKLLVKPAGVCGFSRAVAAHEGDVVLGRHDKLMILLGSAWSPFIRASPEAFTK